jgi:16S rRNA (cytidine1402-2'-O)-methyltransferase
LLRLVGDVPVIVGRELTKTHEELVRGPISEALQRLPEPRGEFVVVAEIGHTTEDGAPQLPGAHDIGVAFGQLTENGRSTRRQAMTTLAKRYRMSAKAVYAAIEEFKDSVV